MNDLERLLAIEDIRQLKTRYFRAIDTHDWDLLATVFAEDAVFDATESTYDPVYPEKGGPEGSPWVGRAQIIQQIKDALTEANSAHHGHVSEIEITSDTTARGIVPMEDNVRRIDGSIILRGYGYYHETYEKVDGAWQIKTSRIQRLRTDLG